jgi:hypothetical protein
VSIELSDIKLGLGMVFAGLALGIALGIGFGVNEDAFKDFVADGIAAHPTVHDAKSQDKIWRYAQRAHFHSTGIAAFSIGLLLLVSASSMGRKLKSVTGVLIGLGAFYPLAWLSMFFLAPAIGRGAAHSHLVTELFTYLGVAGLLAGFVILTGNLFFGLFSGKTPGE